MPAMRSFLFAAALIAATAASAQENARPPAEPSQPVTPTPAAPPNAEALADCLVKNSGQPESEAMRRVMVAALSDDVPGLKNALSDFSGLLMKLSMNSCGVGLSRFEDPASRAAFQQASSRYGAVLGEKLMQDAFAKLN